jgi:hypothetical protein
MAAAAAVAVPSVIVSVPARVVQEAVRNQYVIYPDQYRAFQAPRISFAAKIIEKKATDAKKGGGGEMLFMNYVYPDGATKPLCVQAPMLFAVRGVQKWEDGGMSMLLSFGRDWEKNDTLVGFQAIANAVWKAACDAIVERSWDKPKFRTGEALESVVTRIVDVGRNKDTDEPYPPSMRAVVDTQASRRSAFFLYPTNAPMPPADIADSGANVEAIVTFDWIFRRRNRGDVVYSIHVSISQALVRPGGVASALPAGRCCVASAGDTAVTPIPPTSSS